jgi:predicted nucleic acid-binding protein
MTRVFVDTDVCIDLLSGRQPFNKTAEIIFSMADSGKVRLFVSSLSFSNIDYVLRSNYPKGYSRQLLVRFKTLVKVLSVDERTIDLAIASDFNDFEDAIQYACALNNDIPMIMTRNTRDYRKSEIPIITPDAFLSSSS